MIQFQELNSLIRLDLTHSLNIILFPGKNCVVTYINCHAEFPFCECPTFSATCNSNINLSNFLLAVLLNEQGCFISQQLFRQLYAIQSRNGKLI